MVVPHRRKYKPRTGRLPSDEVKLRLVKAGLRTFAEIGYDGAKVRDLCKSINTEYTQINYQFGSKSTFFQAVHDYAREILLKNDVILGVTGEYEPWDLLSQHVKQLLNCSYEDELYYATWLYLREMFTLELAEQVRFTEAENDTRKDYQDRIIEMLAKILGGAASQTNLTLLRYTYCSLCLFLVFHRHLEEQTPFSPSKELSASLDKETIHAHIMRTVRSTVNHMLSQELDNT